MATKKRRKTKARKRSYRRGGGLMGLGNLRATASESAGKKVGRSLAKILAGVLVGGAAGAYVGKYSGAVGLASVVGAEFLSTDYRDYVSAMGLGMIVASPQMLGAAKAAPATGVAGFDMASFHQEGISRLKNFAKGISEKAGAEELVAKQLGLGSVDDAMVTTYDRPVITEDDYNNIFQESMSQAKIAAEAATQPMSGTQSLLAGSGTRSMLAGFNRSSLTA